MPPEKYFICYILRYYQAMSEEKFSKHERETLLLKLEKEFAYAGASIPLEMASDGELIDLKAFVFRTSKNRGKLTPEETAEVDRIISLVRKKRREIVSRIARETMTKTEAMGLYNTALGLDRALDTLYNASLPRSSLKEESRKAKLEDGRRWLSLVKRVYTGEDRRKRD
jgi:hypothetical protein